jgi:hypothetical protein
MGDPFSYLVLSRTGFGLREVNELSLLILSAY